MCWRKLVGTSYHSCLCLDNMVGVPVVRELVGQEVLWMVVSAVPLGSEERFEGPGPSSRISFF